jgi:hypothetical protein
VGYTGGDDHDLSSVRLDGGISYREHKFALLDDEDLGVGVRVQFGATSGCRLREEKRDVRVAVKVTLELPHSGSAYRIDFVEHVGHVLLPDYCDVISRS